MFAMALDSIIPSRRDFNSKSRSYNSSKSRG